ncbi:MAG: hypothetical protein ACREUT_08545 [Steroidobacteraceae bacterium]
MTDPREAELERALRQALRPAEPRAGFEERVMRALDAPRRPAAAACHPERGARSIAPLAAYIGRLSPTRPLWALASAIAAVLLVGVGAFSYREHVQAARAAQTRVQVLEALRIANEKLGTAFRLVAEETGSAGSSPAADGRSERHEQFN